jgi:hypothetical protein
MKASCLLSYSSALGDARSQIDRVAKVLAASTPDENAKECLKEGPWLAAADRLNSVCMFRAGKLAGQGRLTSTSK